MALIQAVVSMARKLFGNNGTNIVKEELHQLKHLLKGLSSRDLGIKPEDLEFKSKTVQVPAFNLPSIFDPLQPMKSVQVIPPAKYINVYEDSSITVCTFILNHLEKIPLHDHPGMHGLIKCLDGKIAINSYTPLPRDGHSYMLPNAISSLVPSAKRPFLIPCLPMERVIVSSDNDLDSVCCLSPEESNIHELVVIEGTGVFLDVLAPPYDSNERDCHYFKVVGTHLDKKLNKEIAWLLEVPSPQEFWTEHLEYQGPAISRPNDIA